MDTKQLICPNCGKEFTVDESLYAELLNQVKTSTFNDELNRRVAEIEKAQEIKQQLALADVKSKSDLEKSKKDEEISSLKAQLEAANKDTRQEVELAVAKKAEELTKKLTEKDSKIQELNGTIMNNENAKRLAIMEEQQKIQAEMQKKELEIERLKSEAILASSQNELEINNLKAQHKHELELKDETIAQYKDFKAGMSTKMIGESLEVFCSNQYDLNVRPFMPEAYFSKDNAVVEGTKGDFVFRDIVDGVESVSIMFEMKNEADHTVVKHKNAEFFDKLDKDRKKKNCEYAVLVTMLELDNALYNNGIYTVPQYEKMFVIRPQQFLAIISLLVQVGRNTIKVKQELEEARNREVDVTMFEEKVADAKRLFGVHIKDAANRYNDAIADIDDAIKSLNDMKENLRKWVDHLYKADGKLDDLTVRKLTYKNPTMKAKFDEARKANEAIELED